MAKPEFLALHDYQWGGVAIRVAAESAEALEQALGETWEILAGPEAEDHPSWEYCERNGRMFDLDFPTGSLAVFLSIERKTKGGIILPGGKEFELR